MDPPWHWYVCTGWGLIFSKVGVDLSLSDDALSWLRPKPPMECIPHPYWTYIKCFSALICYEWAYGSTLTLLCLCRFGEDFRKVGVDLNLSDVAMQWLRLKPQWTASHIHIGFIQSVLPPWYAMNGHMGLPSHSYACAGLGSIFGEIGVDLSPSDVVMSWLRLKTPVECIPHPYDMYTECFTTMISYEWTYGSTLTLICQCRLGMDLRKIGVVALSLSDNVLSWLRLKPPVECFSHSYWIYTKCFTTLICYEWVYGLTLTLLCLCKFGVDFRGYWGIPEPECCHNAMVEAQPPMECI